MRRIGLFGGTFDPPHTGHLLVAGSAIEVLALDEVRFVVANDPWQKTGAAPVTPVEIRLDLVRALIAGHPNLVVDDGEVRRGGPSYTVETVEAWLAGDPSCRPVVLLGHDAAVGLPGWHRAADLRAAADAGAIELAVVDRPGSADPLPAGWPLRRFAMPACGVSSSELRGRLADGRSWAGWTTPTVAAVVARHGLYARPVGP